MKKLKIIIIFSQLIISFSFCFSKGTTWTSVFNNYTLEFKGIDNCDTNYAMAVSDLLVGWNSWGTILKTTDAGETWNYVLYDTNGNTPPYYNYAQDISYPTRDFCIIGCDSNSFLKTTDGGKTWNDYYVNLPYTNLGFYDVDMFDDKNGVLGSQKYIDVSHDGFNTWDTIHIPAGDYLFCISMATHNSICLLLRYIDNYPDYRVRFFRSDDGGKIWNEYPHPDYKTPMKMQFIDSLIGYEVGGKSTGVGNRKYILVYKTSDGGHSWYNVLDTEITVSFGLQKLDFYDNDNGIVVGQFGAVFWTHDGGKSWVYDSSGVIYDSIPATMNVCYMRKDRAIIADFWGRIFISSEETGVDDDYKLMNKSDCLAYPNPFFSSFNISFINSTATAVSIDLYDILGNKIYSKYLGYIESGTHQAKMSPGAELSPGFYIVSVRCGATVRYLKVLKGD
jgi:photosystem II stability/assembly factor-like uncharacterized protein